MKVTFTSRDEKHSITIVVNSEKEKYIKEQLAKEGIFSVDIGINAKGLHVGHEIIENEFKLYSVESVEEYIKYIKEVSIEK